MFPNSFHLDCLYSGQKIYLSQMTRHHFFSPEKSHNNVILVFLTMSSFWKDVYDMKDTQSPCFSKLFRQNVCDINCEIDSVNQKGCLYVNLVVNLNQASPCISNIMSFTLGQAIPVGSLTALACHAIKTVNMLIICDSDASFIIFSILKCIVKERNEKSIYQK